MIRRFLDWILDRDPQIDVPCLVCHLTISARSSMIYQRVHEHINTEQHKENENER